MNDNNGRLYVIATPIGNLKDITLRALEILKEVDCIIAEDTRKTRILLNKYQINKPLLSYRDQNHTKMLPQIIAMLQSGKRLALVSDSGTPLISDPGFKLLEKITETGFLVIPIPGPSASIAALSISGLPTDCFTFLGFLPKSMGKRRKILQKFGDLDSTIILYESPFRLKRLLEDIEVSLGNRTIFIANELTKKFEKTLKGNVHDVLIRFKELSPRGEYTICIAKHSFNNPLL
jgi:16S rRNA (cytidine1402-2'-O)-methyltransferase